MKLLRATFLSIRGLPDMTCDFSRSPDVARDVVVVTGPPSSGKTRFLEALIAAKEVIAAYGAPLASEPWIRPGDDAAKIELTFQLDDDELRRLGGFSARVVKAEALFQDDGCFSEADEALVTLLETYTHDTKAGKFDYFPANRSIPPPGAMHGLTSAEQRIYRLGRDVRKYSFVARQLFDLTLDAAKQARFNAALTALCPTVHYVAPSADEPLRCLSSKGGPPMMPSELSTTEAEAVLFAATEVMVRHDRSIVFVDRPELSADERSIVGWVDALRGLSVDTQLFVATTSPALLAGVESAAIIQLKG